MTTTPKDPVDALMAMPDPEKLRTAAHYLDFPFMAPSIKEQHEAAAFLRQCADYLEASARALAAVPAPPLTMTGYQLREALEFLAPDGTAEQFEQEVCIQHGPERVCDAGTPDETTDPAGLYCWLSDCPEEGSIALTGEDARIRIETELISQQAGGVPAGWQPIETAPKDGRTLLLGRFNSHKKWRTMRGQWMSEEYIAEQWEEPENGEPGWFETAVEPDDVPNCWATEPTHWMPLPAEPGASPSPSAVQPLSEAQHSRIEADEALMRAAANLLRRYVFETPPSHQPHMITMDADAIITALRSRLETK